MHMSIMVLMKSKVALLYRPSFLVSSGETCHQSGKEGRIYFFPPLYSSFAQIRRSLS